MAPLTLQMLVLGDEHAARAYDDAADRARRMEPAWRKIFRLLERDELGHFRKMQRRYFLTGATKASLTQTSAPGAIRDVTDDVLRFGSGVEQAHYLTKSPHDVRNLQVPKKNRPDLLSAVLVLQPHTSAKAADILLDHVVGDFGRG